MNIQNSKRPHAFLVTREFNIKNTWSFLCYFLLMSIFCGTANAGTVTVASGGNAIPSNTAPGCVSAGTWTTLAGPVYTEAGTAEVTTGTIILNVPSGFEFDTGGTVPTVLITRTSGSGSNFRNINNVASGTSVAITAVTSAALTFTVTDTTSSGVQNSLTWQDIRIRPTASAPLASGNITKSGTATMNGVTAGTTNFGTLTEVASTPVCNPTAPPTVTTNAASALTTTGATLNGTVSSNGASTTVTFDYGLTTGYGSAITATQSPLAANATNTAVSAAVTGLTCNTTYHFRAKGVNSAGTTNGGDLTFTTSTCSLSGVINSYYPGTTASVAVGATSITLGAASGATTPLAIGDTLLIMQMQDASLDATNTATYGDGMSGDPGSGTTGVGQSGLYEYAIAASNVPLGGGTLTLACGTKNAYSNAAATASAGQKKYQVIRVPVYTSGTLTSTLGASAWDGNRGGVLAFDVTGTLTLGSATISLNGLGFRGGAARGSTTGSGANTDYRTLVGNLANGTKGEGIAGTPYYVFTAPSTSTNTGVEGYPNGSFARGAPGNAGGGATDRHPAANDENPGGGGGANGGTGGMGGIGWCSGFTTTAPYYGCGYAALATATNPGGSTGGFGGTPVTGLGATRLTLGGGGGSGTTNNSTGTLGALSSSGAAGGGIVMIRAGSMTGAATFNANGSDGDDTVRNDGSGGGGAGGAVLISAGSGMGGVTINVKGGKGGNNLVPPGSTATPHGPGGGGGGGYALTSTATPPTCSATGGTNGITYNNGILFGSYAAGSYGATSGTAGSCTTGLVDTQIPGTALGATSCTSTLHHFTITVGGSATTCDPQTVIITAYDAAGNVFTGYIGTVSITTSTNHGDWSQVAVTGTLTNGPADSGAATYTFVAGDAGAKSLELSNHHAESLTITTQDGAVTNTSGTVTFSDNAFIITPTTSTGGVANSTEIVAGRNHGFRVEMWRKNPGTGNCAIASGYNGTKNLDGWLTLDALDPGGTAPTIGGVSLPSTAPAVNPASNNLSVTFTNGVANITLSTTDVGKYILNLRDDTRVYAGGTNISGSSDSLIVRPFGLGITNINKGGTNNPGGTASAGIAFVAAGDTFSATVGGYLWATADDANNDGIPDAGVDITDNGLTPHFAYSTALASSIHTPAGGINGTLSGTTPVPQVNFSGGKATVSDLAWDQVGSLYLNATATNYLGVTGVNLTGRSPAIGRIYPHHFTLLSSSITAACNGFTYMGQSLPLIAYTLQAEKLGNGITSNYDNNTLGYTLIATPTLAAENNDAGVNLVNRITTSSSPKWTAGKYIFSDSSAVFARATPPTPDGPYDSLQLGVKTTGGDGVLIQNMDMRATTPGACTTGTNPATDCDTRKIGTATKIRYGRLRPLNAYGPETGTIVMPVHMEYYNGTTFIRNILDNCTTLSSPADCTPTTGNYTLFNAMASNSTCTIVIGTGTATTTLSVLKTQPSDPSPGIAKEGIAKLSFTPTTPPAPPLGKTNTGFADLTALINASLPWLLYEWDGADNDYNENPTGRANFGIYRGNDRIINWREIIR